MTEIEQLRADIATLESSQKLIFEMNNDPNWAVAQCIAKKQKQLAKLEAEAAAAADPWKNEKHILGRVDRCPDFYVEDFVKVAKYARHLEQRVAELEAELASEKKQVDNIDSVAHIFRTDCEKLQQRVAELEAELKETKSEAEQQEAWAATYDSLRVRAENEQRRLEAELAKRPVVWCVRHPSRGCTYLNGDVLVFPSRNAAQKEERQGFVVEPYTGDQK